MTIINSVNYSSGGTLDYIPITTYAELISAMSMSNDLPLRIMNDMTATAEIITNSTNIVDLHGHTITGTESFRWMSINSGNVTLCDLSVAGNGKITNFGTNYSGGGVYIKNSGASFTMTGGSIENCGADMLDGGGVCIFRGTFIMTGGSITGCSAVNNAGGVSVVYGTFTMSGGNISGCTATKGGGVYVDSRGTFTMTGGFIVQNTATTSNGGVYGTYTKTGGYVGGNDPQE